MMIRTLQTALVAAALFTGLAAAGAALSQVKGAYTPAQVERGTKVFATSCALCHGESLSGGPGTPPLKGPEFMFTWKGKNAGELIDYIKANMPPGQTGSLGDQQYADLAAVILQANEQPVGDAELTAAAAAQKAVKITAP